MEVTLAIPGGEIDGSHSTTSRWEEIEATLALQGGERQKQLQNFKVEREIEATIALQGGEMDGRYLECGKINYFSSVAGHEAS